MLRVRRIPTEPDNVPPPWRQVTPIYAVVILLVFAVFAAMQATWNVTHDEPAAVLVAASVAASLIALVIAVYGPVKESLPMTQFTRFTGIMTAGVPVVAGLDGTPRLISGLILLVSALLVITEATFIRARLRVARWVVRLPGHRDIRQEGTWDDTLLVLGAIAPLGAIVSIADGGNSLWWKLSSGPFVVIGLVVTAITIYSNLVYPRRWQELADAIAAYDPEFVLYTSRPDDASYQITMWLPYLAQSGKRFLVVARTPEAAAPLAGITEAPVVMLRAQRSLEALLTPSLGAVFYVNASSGNNAMVRHSQIIHVYLGHGDSDKPPSYNPTHAMYDRVFAAGQAAIDRYPAHGVQIAREKFVIVGRPQVTDIDVVESAPAPLEKPTVLYAPTWRGHVGATAFQSLPVGEKIVSALVARGARVIFRPHPFSYDFPEDAALISRIQAVLAADKASGGTEHVYGEVAERTWTVLDCMNRSDAMVSDVSSVVSDYLYSGKPFAMVDVSEPVDQFIEHYPVAKGAYVLDPELSNLDDVLDDLLGDDPLRDQRWATRSYYLGEFAAEGYGEHFVQAVRDAAEDGQRAKKLGTQDRHSSDDGSESAGEGAVGTEEMLDMAGDNDAAVAGTGVFAEAIRLTRAASRTQTVRTLTRAFPVVLLALIAVISPHWVWAAGTLVAALIAGVALIRRRIRAEIRIRTVYGNEKAPWLALAIGIGLSAAAGTGLTDTALWLVIVGLPTIVAAIAAAGFLLQYRGVFADHLPGIRVSPQHAPMILAVAGLVALALVGWVTVIAVVSPSPDNWWITVLYILAAATAALVAATFVLGLVQSWRSARDGEQLSNLIEAYGPQFEVYFGANNGANYQYGMWAEYFDRIDRPYIVVVRAPAMLQVMATMTSAPVVLRPTLRSLDEVDVPSLSTVFYVNNATRNTHMVERAELVNIWLNHGDSEKPACYNPVHAIYNKIFSAGQAGIDRYERHGVNIPREKFVITGRPQVEHIAPLRTDRAGQTRPTVLYAPTWVGPYSDTDVYSLPVSEELITRLLKRDVRVIFRAHPLNYNQVEGRTFIDRVQRILAQDARSSGRGHIWGEQAEEAMSLVECFNESDAMICDISAVISDYLQSAKPFAVMAMGRSIDELTEEVPAARAGYVIPGDLSGLDERLNELLESDSLAEQRQEMRRYYLGDFPNEGYADHFLNAARSIIDAGRRP
ncbi:CDP-Glycerol:Poly(glycerophosphate) glycerophosphotransferase [Micrococcales bacterium KH10]|nr:CDP-Glycerol:Poly(glycerophosphate) glycerophosphotransferase [Micrococcales bacterium KH10]